MRGLGDSIRKQRHQGSQDEDWGSAGGGVHVRTRGLGACAGFRKPGARVIADSSAVILGLLQWNKCDPSVLSYKNPYGGVWSQMREILEEKSEAAVVVGMVQVKVRLTKQQADAKGEGGMHTGNEKTDVEAGEAAGAIVTTELHT